jgi:hypothetical protein
VGDSAQNSGESSFGEILGLKEEIGKIQVSIAEYETGKKLNIAIIAGTFRTCSSNSPAIEPAVLVATCMILNRNVEFIF